MQATLRSFLRQSGRQLLSHLGTLLLGMFTVILMALFWHGGKLNVRISNCAPTTHLLNVQLDAQALQAMLTINLTRL
jgi:predicted DNA repair protein MutK